MEKLALVINAIDEVLAESGRVRELEIGEDTRLRQDLGLDSLDLAVLTVKVESRTGIDVFAKGIVHTVGEVLMQINDR